MTINGLEIEVVHFATILSIDAYRRVKVLHDARPRHRKAQDSATNRILQYYNTSADTTLS